MREGIILKEHLVYFAELDPLGILERAYLPGRVCIGTVIGDKKSGYDIPVALLMLRVQKDQPQVEWLYVSPPLQKHGIGARLMNIAFAIAKNRECQRLELYTFFDSDRSVVCPIEEDYFSDYSFSPVKELSGEWSESLDMIVKRSFKDVGETEKDNTASLSLLKGEAGDEAERELAMSAGGAFSGDPGLCFKLADRDVSRIISTDGHPEGVLLVQKCEDSLYVTGIAADNEEAAKDLVRGAALAAYKKYGAKQRVKLIKHDDSYIGLIRALFTESKPNRLYSADVAAYDSRLEELRPLPSLYDLSSILSP